MSPVRLTAQRTFAGLRSSVSGLMTFVLGLGAVSALFVFDLGQSEGNAVSLVSLWGLAFSRVLPVLSALYAMDVWSGERRTGRIEALLSVPVSEHDLVVGKVLGVMLAVALTGMVSFVVDMAVLRCYSAMAFAPGWSLRLVPMVVILGLQALAFVAVGNFFSAKFVSCAAAAFASMVVLVGLPRGGWYALLNCFGDRVTLGEMPFDAHVIDAAGGTVLLSAVMFYPIVAVAAIFLTTKSIVALRMASRGLKWFRLSMSLVSVLALALAAALVALSNKLDFSMEVSAGGELEFSERTRGVIGDLGGEVVVTVFADRHDRRYRESLGFLRRLKACSESVGGVRFRIVTVDPVADFHAARKLVDGGANAPAVVFSRGRRQMSVALDRPLTERTVISAILSVAMPPRRSVVRWVVGHGEYSITDYGPFGLSDFARELAADGYRNETLELTSAVPDDCALVVVAGAKSDFSAAELQRLNDYLQGGGRLMVLSSSGELIGLSGVLSSWGIRQGAPVTSTRERMLDGYATMISDFGKHPIVSMLRASRLVFASPMALSPSAAAEGGVIDFTSLARIEGVGVAAIAEKGGVIGDDLTFMPTRVVAVGDATFVLNRALAATASANLDFALNCIAYLSGSGAMTASGKDAKIFLTGLDRKAIEQLLLLLSVGLPLVVLGLGAIRFHSRKEAE